MTEVAPSWEPPRLAEVWGLPGFRRFFLAGLTARLGSLMVVVTIPLLVLDRGGDVTLAGATVAAMTLPGVLTAPVLGAWLDRAGRRMRLIALDQVVMAVVLVAIALAGAPWWLPLLALPAGISSPLSAAGFTSAIPALVPAPQMRAANSIEATSYNLATVLGPALAGTLALAASPVAGVLAQAALKGAALVLALLTPERRHAHWPGEDAALGRIIRAGLGHLLRTAELLAITVAGSLALVGRGMLVVAFPVLGAAVLGGADLSGYVWAAFAAGCILGALGANRAVVRRDPLMVALVGIGLSGLLMLAWPLVDSLVAALLLATATGVAYGPALAATFSVRQEATPPRIQSQVMMTSASLKPAALGLGSLAAGPLLVAAGLATVFVAAASATLAAALAGRLIAMRSRPVAAEGGAA